MDHKLRYESITASIVLETVAQYDAIVPVKLTDLDQARYEDIPASVAGRNSEGEAYLTLSEVATLVDWKLSHGTFRPSLKKLVSQNTDAFVQETTRTAFAKEPSDANIRQLITELSKLRGTGPATASLLLSVCYPEIVPFFSDELFRWVFWADGRGVGWDRPIKYTVKEYVELFTKVVDLQKRLRDKEGAEVSAVDIEKAAYVLGKQVEGHVVNTAKAGASRKHARDAEAAASATKEPSLKKVKSVVKTEAKRVKQESPPAKGTRRSQRTR